MTTKVVIVKPVNQFSNRMHAHCGDSFREMVDLWNEHGLVDVEHSETSPYCWYGKDRSVLLYDRDNLNWMRDVKDYSLGLFGNPVAPDNGKYNTPWIMWGRSPRLLHEYHEKASSKSFQERLIPSIFLGKIENEVQHSYRDVDRWKDCIHEFHCNVDPTSGTWKYTKEEYLEKLGDSRFGLCLRGFGPKCNREIELLGMGVVPLVTPEVNLDYYRPLEENVHYIRVENPEDVERVVRETSEETWTTMSNACKTWYTQNCSPQGSFEVTQEIVNRYKKPSSICTLCTNMCMDDMRLFLKTVKEFEPNTPVVVLCDAIAHKELKSVKNVHAIECLNDYSNKNRKMMDQEGISTEFWRWKLKAINEAHSRYYDTVFLDCDIALLQPLPVVDTHKDVGLCPHYVKQDNCDKYGYYNAGYVYVKSKEFTQW